MTIINVYCPNEDRERKDFLERHTDEVTTNENYLIALKTFDKRLGVGQTFSKFQLDDLRATGCLTDAFRFAHPGVRSYAFHDVIHDVITRIDLVHVREPSLPT